ncbi:MAG TPA: mechanosensitive ion channel family protein [Terriglobales bacterium]|jgi:moderate conductance mechanosensitive channel|nr:mechanosensitive ion channel family protein [Terriglobales bacterium]
MTFQFMSFVFAPETPGLPALLHNWREDSLEFLRKDAPKLVFVVIGAIILIRILRWITRGIGTLRARRFPTGLRTQQVQTIAAVINGFGTAVILMIAGFEALSLLGLNLGPLLASAGIAGLAIGFGAQTLVHDVINGFFILLEDQFDIGDTVRLAGVKGTVEQMSLRHTVLRDDDGTLHMVPNSQITIVSNQTRDWAQVSLRVAVAYDEPSDRIVNLLQRVGEDVRHDPRFSNDVVGDVQVPGIERVGKGEADYLILMKTRPGKQYEVSRELRARIKQLFEAEKVKTPGPGVVFVGEQ